MTADGIWLLPDVFRAAAFLERGWGVDEAR